MWRCLNPASKPALLPVRRKICAVKARSHVRHRLRQLHQTLTCREATLATDVNITPLEDRVLVTVDDSVQTTSSGLVIPDTAQERPQQGSVIAVGPGKRSETTGELIPLGVKAGDTVLFSKYGGTEVKHGGKEYLILSARDILAVIN